MKQNFANYGLNKYIYSYHNSFDMKMNIYICFVALLCLIVLPQTGWSQRAGDLDRSFNYGMGENFPFNIGNGANNEIRTVAKQADGKLIIGGNFTTYNGIESISIARIFSDGTIDTTFKCPFERVAFSGEIGAIEIQNDGKILVSGFFRFNESEVIRSRLIRLNSNGLVDTTFIQTTINSIISISQIKCLPNGSILICGGFSRVNGVQKRSLARLNSNGSLDTTFNAPALVNSWVTTMAIQPDGKIIIGGRFSISNGYQYNNIARLLPNGSVDATFFQSVGANNSVSAVALQPDGKIIIAGRFTSYNGRSSSNIARLTSWGIYDSTFQVGAGFSPINSDVFSLKILSNGKILACGIFRGYGGFVINSIARINSNGILDRTFGQGLTFNNSNEFPYQFEVHSNGNVTLVGRFTSVNGIRRLNIVTLDSEGRYNNSLNYLVGSDDPIYSAFAQQNGKILIGGIFKNYNNVPKSCFTRLNSDGSLDTGFQSGPISGSSNFSNVNSFLVRPDDKIIVGGFFSRYNGTACNNIIQLNTNGTLDSSFSFSNDYVRGVTSLAFDSIFNVVVGGEIFHQSAFTYRGVGKLLSNGLTDRSFAPNRFGDNSVASIDIQPDGKILASGSFTSYSNFRRNRIVRLNRNGSVDGSFNPNFGANTWINKVIHLANGKVLIAGDFTTYNRLRKVRLARLNSDASLDTTFNLGTGPNRNVLSMLVLPSEKILICGSFDTVNGVPRNNIARLNSDGTLDHSFNPGLGANDVIRSMALQPDGRIIIAGAFTNYNNLSVSGIARIHGDDCLAPSLINVTGSKFLCSSTTTLTSSIAQGNLWNTGDTSRSIIVSEPGNYTVRTTQNGCTVAISQVIKVRNGSIPATPIIQPVGTNILSGSIDSVGYEWTYNGTILPTSDRFIPIIGDGNYTAQAISPDGCRGPVSAVFTVLKAKTSFGSHSVILFPNPTTGNVTLTTTADAENVSVVNAVGQVVYTAKAQAQMEMNLNHLAKGVYMVQVQSAKGVSSQRLVIK